MGAGFGDPFIVEDYDQIGFANGREAMGNSDIVVRPTMSRSNACWIRCSVSVSTDEVASSRMRIWRVLKHSTRQFESLCFWLPESLTPVSPIIVS